MYLTYVVQLKITSDYNIETKREMHMYENRSRRDIPVFFLFCLFRSKTFGTVILYSNCVSHNIKLFLTNIFIVLRYTVLIGMKRM